MWRPFLHKDILLETWTGERLKGRLTRVERRGQCRIVRLRTGPGRGEYREFDAAKEVRGIEIYRAFWHDCLVTESPGAQSLRP